MFYVVSPPDKTAWSFESARLKKLLERDWPGVEVASKGGLHPALEVTWRVHKNGDELDGSQDRAGQAQYLEGPLELIAKYAAWLRAHVDASQPLVLYDESYTKVVPLTPGIREDELLERLSS